MTTGLQISLIGHQTMVLDEAGSARGRFNTVFMAAQFAFGAAAAGLAWKHGGWTAVMAMARLPHFWRCAYLPHTNLDKTWSIL